MAVYTYTSELYYPTITEYANTPISVLAIYTISEFVSSSSIYFLADDYGLITESSGIISSDYGNIIDAVDSTEDYYFITITDSIPVFGFIRNIVSNTEYSILRSSVGGIEFVLQGGSYSSFGSAYIGYDSVEVNGAATNIKNTESYVGSGLLFGFGSKAEKISFSYNDSSAVGDFIVDDFGSIADIVQFTEDCGSVAEPTTSYEDYYYLLNITIDDCGSITNPAVDIDSYGLVSENPVFYDDYGNLELPPLYDADRKPFGFSRFSGSLVEKNTESYVGSGSLFAYVGGAEVFGANPPESTQLFRFSGASTESYTPATEVGSGSLFGFGSKAEKVTFSYNQYSVNYREDLDYGFISQSVETTEDYEFIIDVPDSYNDYFDYGLVSTLPRRPYGFISFQGTPIVGFRLRTISFGSLFAIGGGQESTTEGTYNGSGTINLSGAASNIKNTESYVGTGSLFGFGSKAEKVTFSYNDSSVVGDVVVNDFGSITDSIQSAEDYGTISESPTSYEDYYYLLDISIDDAGSISNPALDIDGYGFIAETPVSYDDYGTLELAPTYSSSRRPFGFTRLSSAVVEKNTESYVGSGSLFVYVGAAEEFGANPPENIQLFRFSGAASNIKNTESYVGTGSLFGFGSKAEEITFGEDVKGLFRINGFAIQKNTESYVGYNSLSINGNVIVSVKPQHNGSGTINLSGAASNIKNTESYVGTGSLFGFGSKAEKVTFSYNDSSVVGDVVVNDFGSITDSEQVIEDYGTISESPTSYEDYYYLLDISIDDYGSITSSAINIDGYGSVDEIAVSYDDYGLLNLTPSYSTSRRPFGLFRFSSAVIEKNTESYVGSGSLFAYVGGAEVFGANPPENIQLFRFSGAASDIKNTESYVGTGSLFAYKGSAESTGVKPPSTGLFRFSGSLVEKNTESYVGTGSLFAYVGGAEVFSANPPENIQLFRFFGSVVQKNTESYVGTGSLFGFGSKAEKVTFSYNDSSVVGDIVINDFGSIVNSIESVEDYGTISESPTSYEDYYYLLDISIDDYGLITNSPIDIDSYGLIAEPFGAHDDYGNLLIPPSYLRTKKPYGFSRFSGSLVEKNTESYVGSGSLFAYKGAAESTGVNPPSTGLFRFSGSVFESYTPTTEIGSGKLFGFGNKAERTTYSYNSSSVVGERLLSDYGFISYTINESEDYGNLLETVYGYDDFGSVSVPVKKPYGFSRFSGSLSDLKVRLCYFGSGSLFAYTGAAEAFGANPPENIQLFRFSGSVVQKNTESYVGSGSLFTYVGAAESISSTPQSTGLFRFSGSLVEKNTESYVGYNNIPISGSANVAVKPQYDGFGRATIFGSAERSLSPVIIGSGSLFTAGGRAEVFVANPPENTQLFKFSGSLVEKNTESYVGSGSLFAYTGAAEAFGANPPENIQLFRFSGASTESYTPATEVGSGSFSLNRPFVVLDPEDKIRLSNVYESFSFRPKPSTIEMSLSGELGIYFVNIYQGNSRYKVTGSATIKTNPVHVGSGKFQTGGNCKQSFTPAPHRGSGSLFSYTGSAEAFTSNPPENIQLFRFSGSLTESYSPGTEVGSGFAKLDINSLILIKFDYPVKGKIDLNGTSNETSTEAYRGRGKTEISGDAGIYFANRFESVPTPVRIFVNGKEKITIPQIGSGSLFGFGSRVEVFGANPPENISLFNISGSAKDTFRQSHIGSGRFKFNSTISILDSNNKPRIVGSYESVSSTPPLKSRSINIKGSIESESTTETFIGSGSLFGFGSRVEVFGANPPENTSLFKISGKAEAKEIKKEVGSGSLFAYTGSAESFTGNPPENTQLFEISGTSTESYTPGTELGSGKLFGFGGGAESTSISEVSKVIFEFNGSSGARSSKSYSSQGSIFGFGGSSPSRVYIVKPSERAFRIFGRSFGSFAHGVYYGECSSKFVGKSFDEKINYESPKPIILYII